MSKTKKDNTPAAAHKKRHQQNSPKKQPGAAGKPVTGSFYLPLFIILIITFIAYLPSLSNGLLTTYDDDEYIIHNTLIRSIHLKELFSQYVMGNYHPLTMLTYAIEYHFFHLGGKGYHAVNLLLHLCNTAFVFYAVFLLSKKMEIAWVAALLFGIHPVHVESVAWVAELKDLLYTFFFLASYICYLNYLKDYSKRFYFYALLLFLLSLLSKAMAASLPVVLILTDYLTERKTTLKTVAEKLPFFALSVIFGIVAVIAQKSSSSIQDIDFFSFPQRVAFACYGFVSYLIKLVLPFHLNALYPYPLRTGSSIPSWYYGYVLIFVFLAAGVIYTLRFSKKPVFGFGFFTVTVFLVLQLLPVGSAIMADRYSYIPSIGIFYLAGEGLYLLWNKKKKNVAIAIVSVFALFFTVKTYSKSSIWKDDYTLWSDVIKEDPTVQQAFNNRGSILKDENRDDEAISDFTAAIQLRPHYSDAYYNRASIYSRQSKLDDALNDLNTAINLKPSAGAYNNRGIVWANKKRYDEAEKDFSAAIKLKPDNTDGYLNRGQMLNEEKNYPEALKDFNTLIQLQPSLPDAYYDKAKVEYAIGQKDSACADLQQAINLKFAPAEEAYRALCH